MSKKIRKLKTDKLFNPDLIATAISQALTRDFREAQHVYCLNDTSRLYAFNRQANELLKKYCSPTQDKDLLQAQAFEKFEQVNEHMWETNARVRNMPFQHQSRIQSCVSFDDKVVIRAKHLIHQVLGQMDLEKVYTKARNSSGTSIGVPYQDTSEEGKLTFPITVTERCVNYLHEYYLWDVNLREAVKQHNRERPLDEWYKVVDGSRATTVDKTTDKRRFICIEPTGNMFFQQGLMRVLYECLAFVGLDVRCLPDIHKELARLSSISCKNATVDWSSASDCVSIELLRYLLPPKWFELVWDLRCDETTLDGKSVTLNMISTMGNAVTFPLETLIFWAFAKCTVFTKNNPRSNSMFPLWEDEKECCSVFGDDCILPSYAAEEYIRTLTRVGFIVNKEKSFYGPLQFRESCGGDYLAGYDVRPFSLKAPSSTKLSALEPWLYIIMNALVEKYILYFGELSYVYDKELWRVIAELFRKHKLEMKLVPPHYPDDSGVKGLTQDIFRWRNQYPVALGRIDRSNHGTYTFRYCRFVYRDKTERNDHIRYALWLKQPVMLEDGQEPTFGNPIRRNGGYVVAKSLTAHWVVPRVKVAP